MRKLIRISLFSILFILSVSDASTQVCDYIYVSTSPLANDTYDGSENFPVSTLHQAMTLVNGTRRHIRMEGGWYNEPNVIHLQNNVTIEGGYVWYVVGGWFKSTTSTTMILFGGEYTDPTYNLTSRIGFNAIGVNNWG